MRSLRLFTLAIALAAAAFAAGTPGVCAENRAAVPPETLAVARELFSVTFDRAAAELNAQAVDLAWPSLESSLRARNPNLDAEKLAGLRRDFERIRLQKLRDLMKDGPAVYARHLSQEDMVEISQFYRTPAGTRLLQAVPAILAEIFAIALPAMPAVMNDTNEEFVKLARDRGLIR
jgi:hypothetical protein